MIDINQRRTAAPILLARRMLIVDEWFDLEGYGALEDVHLEEEVAGCKISSWRRVYCDGDFLGQTRKPPT